MNENINNLLSNILDDEEIKGAYNIRVNGESSIREITDNVDIVSKKDGKGIEVYIKENVNYEFIYVPVLITESGFKDIVYNDFYIGKNSNVYIMAGCAIQNNGDDASEHDGVHRFFIEEGANVTYIENHYGEGHNHGGKLLNPITEIHMKSRSSMIMKTVQIKGVDESNRKTVAFLESDAKLEITEKIMTDSNQNATTLFEVNLDGNNSSCHIVSRSFAVDESYQKFTSKVIGNKKCYAHVECDAIIKDKAKVVAIPEINANNVDANLVHEASIGKIAKEQVIKLMTLGLSEKEAEEQIIKGFLK